MQGKPYCRHQLLLWLSQALCLPILDDLRLQDAFRLEGEPYCHHQLLKFGSSAPVIIAVGTGLALPGYTLIVDEAGAADLYAALVNKVCHLFFVNQLFECTKH